ncbi:tRNA 2-thiouridine(34) synthase MnmA [Candidatus Parcubacteria bacterium]|nr:MAG: tRNA 2-thiouridine(34) synthase MnmA [Candidatus Parcubacteria bacterium]
MSKPKQKVLVAISGGVDSSAAAFLLKKQGYQVEGVFMRIGDNYQEAELAARKVCDFLKIKFYPVNVSQEFKREIIDYFIESYEQGQTPNPCVKCNKVIKFGELMKWKDRLGADFLATGHYVINKYNKEIKEFEIFKGIDKTKDQSYFLYNLKQDQLKNILFPLGNYEKEDIKKMVKQEGIPILEKESMDICFLTESGKAIEQNDFLKKKLKLTKGKIILVTDKKEKDKRVTKEIGEHDGLPLYTIGQRRGVNIGGTGPYYVAGVDNVRNILYVVSDPVDSLLMSDCLESEENNFISNKKPKKRSDCEAVIRYRHKPVKTKLIINNIIKWPILNKIFKNGKIVKSRFYEKQRAITVGQSVVWYQGDRLIGGGVISKNCGCDIRQNVL